MLTHHHFDHVHLADTFAKRYQVPVFMAKTEIDYYGFSCTHLTPITTTQPFMIQDLCVQPIFTPGHTFGGTSYLIGNNLFCGDTLFIEGCGVCFGKGANPETLFDSLQTLKKQVPLNTHIYPGHSYGKTPGKTFKYVLENNVYLQFENQADFVAYRMRKNQKGLFNFQ